MSVSHRLAAFAMVTALLAPGTTHAADEFLRASGSGPTELRLCKARPSPDIDNIGGSIR